MATLLGFDAALACGAAWTLVALLVGSGCGGGGGAGNANDNANLNVPDCPATHRPEGPACVPLFDRAEDCPGDAEMPALGGGCEAVGVAECDGGLLVDGACRVVGVDGCAAGFVADGEGGCDPVLPPGPDPCPTGTLEVLGEATCQPVGDCGDTGPGAWPWGLVTDDGTTVFVDATADASGADGSSDAPYPTIAGALAAVAPGGQVAVAAGEYAERVTIDGPVRLVGRCAALVTVRGGVDAGQPYAAVTIGAGGAGASVGGLTLSGPGEGLVVDGASQVTVTGVQVLDTGDHGIWAVNDAEVRVVRSVVAGATTRGVAGVCSRLTIEQSVVRGTRPQPGTDEYGRGIQAHCEPGMGTAGTLAVTGSLVTGNRDVGVFVGAVDATITSSVVRDTLPRVSDQGGGRGINGRCHPALGICGSLAVTGSLIAGNREMGVYTSGLETTITSSVVRDTLPSELAGDFGRGINAACDVALDRCGSLAVTGSLVAGNRMAGVMTFGVPTTVTSSVVRDTLPRDADLTAGLGIGAGCDPELSACGTLVVTESLVAGNHLMGITAGGTDATVISSVVRDTLPQQSNQAGGYGIGAVCHPDVDACGSLAVTGSSVLWSRHVGIFVGGVHATIRASTVSDTQPQQSDQTGGRGINAQCNAERGVCGSLTIERSLVARSFDAGVFVIGVPASLHGTAIVGTRPDVGGPWQDDFGQALWAQCDPALEACGTLELSSCLVEDSHTAAVASWGVSGTILGSVIRDVAPRPLDGTYGYGLQVEGRSDPGAPETILHVTGSQIADATVAGILYYRATGTLSGAVVTGADFAVAYSSTLVPPVDGGDSVLDGIYVDGISRQELEPSPAPPPVVVAQ